MPEPEKPKRKPDEDAKGDPLPKIEILTEVNHGYWQVRIWQNPPEELTKETLAERALEFSKLLLAAPPELGSNPLGIAQLVYRDERVLRVQVKGTHGSILLHRRRKAQ